MKQKQVIVSVTIVLVLIVAGVFLFGGDKESLDSSDNPPFTDSDTGLLLNEGVTDWRELEFRDVKTQEVFKISDFKGKPILLESFAVWCPTCKKQQDEIKSLHDRIGDAAISISLDLDPNEDQQKILGHIRKNNYDWYFAVSPPAATKLLMDEFGIGFSFAPGAPVVLIDKDLNGELLGSGVKSSTELLSKLNL